MTRLTSRAKRFLYTGGAIVVVIVGIFCKEATFVGFTDPVIVETSKVPVEDIWFTSDGTLVAVSYQDLIVTRKFIDPSDKQRGRSQNLDFNVVLAKLHPDQPLPAGLRTNSSRIVGGDGSAVDCPEPGLVTEAKRGVGQGVDEELKDELLFAISDEGDEIAWIRDNTLTVGGIDSLKQDPENSPKLTIPLSPDWEVQALVLTKGSSLVSLLNSDRALITYKELKKLPQSVELPAGRWRIGSHGPSVPATEAFSGRSGLLTLDPDTLQGKADARYPVRWDPNTVLSSCEAAVAAKGRVLAVGSRNGMVTITKFWPERTEQKSLPLPPGKRIRAIALFGNGDLLAAGDFPGIYLVTDRLISQVVSFAPSGVRLIAANGKHLAYATDREVVLMEQRYSVRLTEGGKYGIGICFGLLGLLGFFRACFADRRSEADTIPATPSAKSLPS